MRDDLEQECVRLKRMWEAAIGEAGAVEKALEWSRHQLAEKRSLAAQDVISGAGLDRLADEVRSGEAALQRTEDLRDRLWVQMRSYGCLI